MKVVDLAVFSSTCEEGTHRFRFLSNVFPLPLVDVRDSLSVSSVLLSAKPAPVSRTQSSLAGTLQMQMLVSS